MNDLIESKCNAWSKIKGNEYLKRAIEVSLTGQHPITIIGNSDNGKVYLEEIFKSRFLDDNIFNENLLTFIQPCPCGNFTDNLQICNCSNKDIINYQKTDMYRKAMNNDIIVRLTTPPFSDYNRVSEAFSIVFSRIKNEVETYRTLAIHSDAMDLLKIAYAKFHFTICQVERVENVAKTIAKMESPVINIVQAHHMAESIQYQNIK